MLEDYLKANLASWDEAVGLHVGSELYDVAGFKAGATSLSPIEIGELGPLVHEGTTLLHLQCHFGLDTLSWARRGAVVTGVDFSGEGVKTARALADDVGLSARATFVRSDVGSLPDVLSGDFDVVFTSWGALIWLGDLERWAEVVAHFLKPGGVLYIAEFHPYAFVLADDATPDSLRIGHPYFMYGVRSASTTTRTTPTPTPVRSTPSPTSGCTASPRSSTRCCAAASGSTSCTNCPTRCPASPSPSWRGPRTGCCGSKATTGTSRSPSR